MRKSKRFVVISLMVLSLMLLTACGGNEDISGKVEPVSKEQEQSVEPQGAEQKTETPSEKPDATVEKEEVGGEPDETVAAEGNSLSLGRLEGGVYTNNYLGIGCTLNSDWTYYSAKELQELPEAVANAAAGSEIGDLMDGATQISDMQAENVNALTTMNLVYTKISMQERLGYLMLNEEETVELMLGQRDRLEEAYTQMGITVHEMKKVQVTFLGEEHFAVWTYADIEEVPYYFLQIQNYRVGEYGATLTVASFVEDHTQEILNLFYALEE